MCTMHDATPAVHAKSTLSKRIMCIFINPSTLTALRHQTSTPFHSVGIVTPPGCTGGAYYSCTFVLHTARRDKIVHPRNKMVRSLGAEKRHTTPLHLRRFAHPYTVGCASNQPRGMGLCCLIHNLLFSHSHVTWCILASPLHLRCIATSCASSSARP